MGADDNAFGFPPILLSAGDEQFPVEDVEASLQDRDLQEQHTVTDLVNRERDHLESVRSAAIERGASSRANWMYFCSPDWTWEQLCGREGWVLYDASERRQYAFQMTVMN